MILSCCLFYFAVFSFPKPLLNHLFGVSVGDPRESSTLYVATSPDSFYRFKECHVIIYYMASRKMNVLPHAFFRVVHQGSVSNHKVLHNVSVCDVWLSRSHSGMHTKLAKSEDICHDIYQKRRENKTPVERSHNTVSWYRIQNESVFP